MSEIHILKIDSPNLDLDLPKVISLSNTIFSADPNTRYASFDYWKERLSHDGSIIIYLTASADPAGAAEYDNQLIAFLFAHRRQHTPALSDGSSSSSHIWLAGVLQEWRRGGCLRQIVEMLMAEHAPIYTICTIPSRFPDMWAWLQKRGWQYERHAAEGRIMFSKKGK